MRRRRSFLPRTVLHVCNRGAMQMKLFTESEDYALCENTLVSSMEEYPVRLYAYCIMPNHWHLLLDGDNQLYLSRFIQHFTSSHARTYRRNEHTVGCGAVYQNRFRAYAVQRNEAFVRVAHYIEVNPVKAGLCKSASDWRWSSAHPEVINNIPLTPWPMEKPYDWDQILTQETRGDWTDRINISLKFGKPLGDIEWSRFCKKPKRRTN